MPWLVLALWDLGDHSAECLQGLLHGELGASCCITGDAGLVADITEWGPGWGMWGCSWRRVGCFWGLLVVDLHGAVQRCISAG